MEAELSEAISKIEASDQETVLAGLDEMKALIPDLPGEHAARAVDAVMGLFYIDPYDRPDLKPVVERASELLASLPALTLDPLVTMLTDADMKVAFNVARTLGRMGAHALGKLIQAFETTNDISARSFIVYAIGKIKHPVIADAIPLLLQASGDSGREVRDSAVRSIGKLAEVVPPEQIDPHERGHLAEALFKAATDMVPAVRAKAVRSLGKMANAGYLTDEQRKELSTRARRILGHDETFNWDLAYIVRKEAEFALRQLGE